MYVMIERNTEIMCLLRHGNEIYRTSSAKRHCRTRYKIIFQRSEEQLTELVTHELRKPTYFIM
jgi:hypothetical protein